MTEEEETLDSESESSINKEVETETPLRFLRGYHTGTCDVINFDSLSVARFSNITHSATAEAAEEKSLYLSSATTLYYHYICA